MYLNAGFASWSCSIFVLEFEQADTSLILHGPLLAYTLLIFQDVVRKVENTPVDASRPRKDVVIAKSGLLDLDKPFHLDV